MTIEIELKFAITPHATPSLSSFLAHYSIISQQSFFLKNCYYDTPNYLLRKNDCGLRVRTIYTQEKPSPQYEMTLKRSNQSVAGLHSREEFTVPIPSDTLYTDRLPPEAWPKIVSSRSRQNKLTALFTTHFKRDTWQITYAKSQIEIALDKGHIEKEDNQLLIDEVELELLEGSVDDLLNFASELSQLGLRLLSQSKAARGYRLVKKNPFYPPEYDTDILDYDHPLPLQKILKFWQNSEEFALQRHDEEVPYLQLRRIMNDVAKWLTRRPDSPLIRQAHATLAQLMELLNKKPVLTYWLYHPGVTQFKLLLQKLVLE